MERRRILLSSTCIDGNSSILRITNSTFISIRVQSLAVILGYFAVAINHGWFLYNNLSEFITNREFINIQSDYDSALYRAYPNEYPCNENKNKWGYIECIKRMFEG